MAGVGILILGLVVSFCDVQGVVENVAMNKFATGADYLPLWLPSKAVDGDNNVNGGSRTCYHANTYPAFWSVDLGQVYQLYTIRVYLRNRSCSNESYGSDCSKTCNNCPHCDRWSGICSGDCYPGWTGQRCDTPCNNAYGINCNKRCSERRCRENNSSCDHVTGSCDSRCLPGWNGTDCTEKCDRSYGEDCLRTCISRHCMGNSSCDHVTGSCDQDCQSGWKRSDCTEACDSDHYGPDCAGVCANRHCEGGSSCNHTSGLCDGGCQGRWAGTDCLRCVNLYYGGNCSSLCSSRHCNGNSSSCDMTGLCDLGCQLGWTGRDCITACDSDHYGPDCTGACATRHCKGESSCNPTGLCDRVCQTGWSGDDCMRKNEPQGIEQSPPVPLIAGAAGGGVVLVIILIIVIVLIRRRRSQKLKDSKVLTQHEAKENDGQETACVNAGFGEVKTTPSLSSKKHAEATAPPTAPVSRSPEHKDTVAKSVVVVEDDEEEEDYDTRVNVLQQNQRPNQPEISYYNLDEVRRSHVIPVSQLEVRVREMKERPEMAEEEFKSLLDGFVHPYDDSQTPGRKQKNRFRGYYPYNYNRVVLHDEGEDNKGDYINASYMDGYNSVKKYIAAQGPYRSDIVEDFWRMIWQEGCRVVVMVTGLMEEGKMKCLRYWPEKGTLIYGNVTVTKETETKLADYTITKLTVQRGKDTRKRQVTHFHFTSWPDHGVPDTSSLLNFMRRVQNTCGQQKHPTVVHCSAGIGRTGTYIAIESLINQAMAEEAVNVVSIVSDMRNQRKNMIQTKEQYLFVYQAVAEAVVEGDTSLVADVIRKIDLGHVSDVIMGNRTGEQHLEALNSHHTEIPSDAVTRVPSYTNRSAFYIMTSHPDMEEAWNYILNNGSRTLVTWSGSDQQYTPSTGESMITSRLTVKVLSSNDVSDNVEVQQLELKEKGEKKTSIIIYHYHVTGSVHDSSISVMIDSLLQRTSPPECGSTTIITDSVIESRLLVLLVNITSRLQDDGKVDVISNMRRLQSLLGGPSFTEDDVRLCLDYAQRRLESLGLYANL